MLSARKGFLNLGLLQCLARFEIFRLSAVDLSFRHGYDLLRKVAKAVKFGRFFAHDLLVPRTRAGVNLGDARQQRKNDGSRGSEDRGLSQEPRTEGSGLRILQNYQLDYKHTYNDSSIFRRSEPSRGLSPFLRCVHKMRAYEIFQCGYGSWITTGSSRRFQTRGASKDGESQWLIPLSRAVGTLLKLLEAYQ